MPTTILKQRPRLAITLGDPAGIGPEVVLKALGAKPWHEVAEITVVGTAPLLEQAYGCLSSLSGSLPPLDSLTLLEVPLAVAPAAIQPGQGNASSGAASFAFLRSAIAATVAGRFDGIVTAPIAKSAWKAAGHLYPGQTELLAEGAGTNRFGMAFVARSPHTDWTLRSLLATTHIPLSQVPQVLSADLLSRKLDLLIEHLRQDFGLETPRVAIAGLNPHSGEQGQLGCEEQDWLEPWLEEQRRRYPQVHLTGPLPPDTMWVLPGQAWFGTDATAVARAHDAYLALYHDQGLIPVKLMAFDRAVNTTVGLPFVRTSPDHGTAFDIAGQGIADATSMIAAIELAIDLVVQRQKVLNPA
ncbi:MAG: 4-hydroxythreonine-4-phosphate dehydrogenase PdxA [Cyanobacteria bacterium Co-bin13]|nr:4-hydroxythreonine-4-phosphate dehydrogenase PdxA [Cyanobacteria bacterium Co-bin13]